jgi:hypothetical protein
MDQYPYKATTRTPFKMPPATYIDWCRDKFGLEGPECYPILSSIEHVSFILPRWIIRIESSFDNQQLFPNFNYYFRNEDDYVLFKMTWL